MPTTETASLEQQQTGLWTACWVLDGVFHALDPEVRERFAIEVGRDRSEGEGLWPGGVKIADVQMSVQPWPRELPDLDHGEVESRAWNAAQLNAAKILTSLSSDRLGAQAARLFDEATRS